MNSYETIEQNARNRMNHTHLFNSHTLRSTCRGEAARTDFGTLVVQSLMKATHTRICHTD